MTLQELACQTLLEAGVERLPVHIRRVAEQWGASVFTYRQYADTVECGVDEVARRYGGDGFTQRIGERYVIFYYEGGNLRRIRWTIAHELAHILLGHLETDGCLPTPEGTDADRLADLLAAELLCPSAVVRACGCTQPGALARLCDISPAAAGCRARELVRRAPCHTPAEETLLHGMQDFIVECRDWEPVTECSLTPLPILHSHRL